MEKINIGVIGAGYWGKNLIRAFNEEENAKILWVSDFDEKKLAKVKQIYPHIGITTDYKNLLKDPNLSAVLIATPVVSHYKIALDTIGAGKHVWIEKPITTTQAEAEDLVIKAKLRNVTLLADHTFLYTGAVKKIKELIDSSTLGDLRYFDSERLNLGLIRQDVDVVYDLAAHDLYILDYILDERPVSLIAYGNSYVTKGLACEVNEMAHLYLEYPSGLMAHIHTSWISPVKLRKMLIGGSKKMILFDDIEPSEKIRIYDSGVGINLENETPEMPFYRSGDVLIPKIDNTEALAIEAKEFINAIREKREPFTGGGAGLRIVKILEAAKKSMKNKGERVLL